MITCYHFSSDDDSEPILGLWFEETLAPPETPPGSHVAQATADSQEGTGKHNTDRTGSIVPEKGEPHGVNIIFGFDYTCHSSYITCYRTGILRDEKLLYCLLV